MNCGVSSKRPCADQMVKGAVNAFRPLPGVIVIRLLNSPSPSGSPPRTVLQRPRPDLTTRFKKWVLALPLRPVYFRNSFSGNQKIGGGNRPQNTENLWQFEFA